MRSIHEIYDELCELHFPRGIPWDDLLILPEVADYEGYIMGFASKYLNGTALNPDDIRINVRLSQRLDQSIEILVELRDFKKKYDGLVKDLVEATQTQA